MARRPDPLRIYAARRAGLLTRLQAEARISEYTAEVWITAWEREARVRGLDGRTVGWWEPAWEWIAQERRRASPPAEGQVVNSWRAGRVSS